jgi:hypothetical protein
MDSALEARRVLARRVLERRKAQADPLYLISHMTAPDERTAETFDFKHLTSDEERWGWQRDFLRWIHQVSRAVALKARQLGATWLCCAYVVWTALYKPGSLSLVYRQKHEEAQENVRRCWTLLNSLPKHLWNGAEVLIPQRGAIASEEIRLRFPDGSLSRIVAMSSASASGHGKTAAVVLLDEFSRIERASEIMKAVQPAAGSKGKILVISTANGRADMDTGEGNYFAWLWGSAETSGFDKRFLSWSLHPDRDQHWYDNDPEIRGLKSHERAEQYPANEHEAFTLTNRVFFSADDLAAYRERIVKPKRRFEFEKAASDKAKVLIRPEGLIRLYEEPDPAKKYAIGADVATGRGADYSAAYVIDLSSMELCAEVHGRLDADLYAYQLHYLGRYYNSATIAVETGGGYGEAVIIPLRDGREGRPAYPRLYKHVLSSRPDLPISKPYGFPTNSKTRPLILNQFEKAVRERTLPFVSDALLWEMESFVYHDHGTSPRAQEGARDDLVMAAAIALEMYRLYGEHPDRKHRKPKSLYKPWLKLGNAA